MVARCLGSEMRDLGCRYLQFDVEPQSYRSLETLSQQSKTRKKKVGRPKLPKGEAKGRIVPVRFTGDDLKAMESAAKASKQNVSEWVRSTIHASLNP
jgi:hypothetical protein